MAYRRDRRDRRGIFKGLDIFIHRGARHKEQFFSDIKALTENGAALVHHPITFLAPILIIVEVSTSTRVKDFVYKINSVPAGQSRVREEGEVTDWNLDQVMGYFSQAPREIPVLQHHWIKDCLEHRRILGKADNWGGWHVKATRDPRLSKLTDSAAAVHGAYAARRANVESENTSASDQRPSLKRHRSDSPTRSPYPGPLCRRDAFAADHLAKRGVTSSRPNGFTAPASLRRNPSLLPRLDTVPTQGPTLPSTPGMMEPSHADFAHMTTPGTLTSAPNSGGARLTSTTPIRLTSTTPISPLDASILSTASINEATRVADCLGLPDSRSKHLLPRGRISAGVKGETSPGHELARCGASQNNHSNLKFREECLLTVPSASGRSPKLEERNEIKDESVTSTRDSTAPCDVEVEDNSLFGSPDSPSIKAETPFSNLDQASVALEEGLSFLSVTSNIEKSHTQPYSVPQIFVLGPNRMLFHVMDSPGRAFLQAAITAGGGSMMELCWATYVIVAPGTTAESMMTFASDKSICARLVRSHWITDSMVAAKLLDPGPYEVSHEDQAKLLGDEVQC